MEKFLIIFCPDDKKFSLLFVPTQGYGMEVIMKQKRNLTRRTLCGVLSAMMTMSGAFAAEYGVTYTKEGIRLSGTADSGAKKIFVTVYPKDCTSFAAADLLGLTVGKSSAEDRTVAIELGIRDGDAMAVKIDGIDIYIREEGTDDIIKTTDEYSPKRAAELLDAIKRDKSAAAIGGILSDEYYAAAKRLIGISDYDNITDGTLKENFLSVLSNSIEAKELTREEFFKTYTRSLGIAEINTKTDVAGGIAKADPSFEGESYSSSEDGKFKSWIAERSGEGKYTSIADYDERYAAFSMLYRINNSKSSEIFGNIGKYADKLGISGSEYYKKYSSLSGERRDRVSEKLANALSLSNAKNGGEVDDAIKKAYNAVAGESSGGNKSGGGSSGGSSGVFSSSNTKDSFTVNENAGNAGNGGNAFNDLDGAAWAKEAITFLSEKGIVNGTGGNRFEPNARVTREQLAKMLVLAAGLPTEKDSETGFSDVPRESWFFEYINTAFKHGIVCGKDAQTFGTGEFVTRQDAAVMAYRTAKARGIAVSGSAASRLGDAADIAEYAKEAVDALSAAGIISGNEKSDFMPLSECTRAETAKIIYLLFY